jgi:hypothetical protein
MKLERSNVEYPLWRKKVDKSLFEHRGTTIPVWACNMWKLGSLFKDISTRRDKNSKVNVKFQGNNYNGWVTVAKHGRNSPAFRLWFNDELSEKLKYTFLMSYMRSLENDLSSETTGDIETRIPFWEFLDIEFNYESMEFLFNAYYRQLPSFPNLFERLIGSPAIQKLSDNVEGKDKGRIYKQDWKPRDQLEYELGAKNVVYMLIDTNNKLIYIGEAQDLKRRLSQEYQSIPNWDFYRYDVLSDDLTIYRVPIERMLIRFQASLLDNKKGIENMGISDYKLANERIDR